MCNNNCNPYSSNPETYCDECRAKLGSQEQRERYITLLLKDKARMDWLSKDREVRRFIDSCIKQNKAVTLV